MTDQVAEPRFGVNYVPSHGWWYSWVDWDDVAVGADLAAIRDLGADHIRAHCLWPLFQPNARMVSTTMLRRTERLLDLADDNDLDVIVTVFNGWLSGFDFRPAWVGEDDNVFTSPEVVQAQLDLLTALATAIGGHRRFLGFDIANEPSVLTRYPVNRVTSAEGDAWVTRLSRHCDAVAPGRMHCVGMDHLPWLTDHAFTRDTLANTGGVVPVHTWTYFTGALERYGENSTGTLHLSEYMLELVKAHQGSTSRPVWLQEVGIAPEWGDPGQLESFVTGSLKAALSVGALWGITWWCSHDISRKLAGFANLEYDLGLLDVANVRKPIGEAFAETVADARHSYRPAVRTTALVLPDGVVPDLRFADRWFDLVDSGRQPAIVLQRYAGDPSHLSARGITELIDWAYDA